MNIYQYDRLSELETAYDAGKPLTDAELKELAYIEMIAERDERRAEMRRERDHG